MTSVFIERLHGDGSITKYRETMEGGVLVNSFL